MKNIFRNTSVKELSRIFTKKVSQYHEQEAKKNTTAMEMLWNETAEIQDEFARRGYFTYLRGSSLSYIRGIIAIMFSKARALT